MKVQVQVSPTIVIKGVLYRIGDKVLFDHKKPTQGYGKLLSIGPDNLLLDRGNEKIYVSQKRVGIQY